MSKRKGKGNSSTKHGLGELIDESTSQSMLEEAPIRITRRALSNQNKKQVVVRLNCPTDNASESDEGAPINAHANSFIGITTSETQSEISQADSIKNSHLSPDEERKCREAAEKYISNCKYFNVAIDPSVVIALQTGWQILHPSCRFTEGSMLPLKNILEEDQLIRKLNLSNVGMQDSR